MARAIWRGEISFGLIGIEVELFSATRVNKLEFHLVDRRDGSRIRYQRVNESTGEEVPWDQIVKSYEYEKGNFVILESEDLEEFAPELTKTIDLEEFIQLSDLSVLCFDKPYYLVPTKRSRKPYVLLREMLKQQDKCGIGRVVIRTKQHLATIFPVGDALVLNLLLFPEELKFISDFDFPSSEDYKDKIQDREIELSSQLIESMAGTWEPEKYHDTYSQKLRDWIEEESKSDRTQKKTSIGHSKGKQSARVVNIEDLLKKSLENRKAAKKTKGRKQS